MTNKFFKFFSLSALLLSTTAFFSSCEDNEDNEPENIIDPVSDEIKKVFILSEGNWDANDATLGIYYPNAENNYQSDVYTLQNNEKLGDVGQDLISYGGRLYLSVFGSSYLAKLDSEGKVVEKYSFKTEEGQPRYLAAKDGFIYVSLYSGQVAKFDTTSISAPKAFVEVGPHPEEICIKDNTLYAAIAGDYTVKYDNRIAVIELSNFSLKEHIEVAEDPTNVIAFGDNLYVIHYNTTTWTQEILEVNPKTKEYSVFALGTKFVTDGIDFYYVNSTFVGDGVYQTEFYKKGSTEAFLDLTSTPELKTAMIYLFNIDDSNGDFYIGTAGYKTFGEIYRFSRDGKFIEKFSTDSYYPNKALLFEFN